MDFTGKNIVITGASSGIGLASARLLAQKGGNVYALSRRARTGERTNCGRGRIIEVGCDVTDSRSVREAFEYIFSDAENIYGLVNCAGTGKPEPWRRLRRKNSPASWTAIFTERCALSGRRWAGCGSRERAGL